MMKTPWYKTGAMALGILTIIVSFVLHLGLIPVVVGVLLVAWYLKKEPVPKT